MLTTPEAVFRYEVQKSGAGKTGGVTTITCHGRLTAESSGEVRQAVKPLIPMGRWIMLDLRDVSYHDGTRRATHVGLKVSSVKDELCKLEFFNPDLAPREKKPRGLMTLAQLFCSFSGNPA
jgi:hypothetical protein